MFKHRKYRPPSQTARKQRAVDRAMFSVRNWQELKIIDESTPEPKVVARVSTLQFGLIIFILAGVLTGYIGHIHTSQDLLGEINLQRRENVRLHLQHNRLVADYNASIGPSVIYERAEVLGLQRGHEYAGLVQIAPPIEP